MSDEVCGYCGRRSEGNYAIHRDGFCKGPEVALCDACGGDAAPSLEEVRRHLGERAAQRG